MTHSQRKSSIKILLADDDKDDRFFFGVALKSVPVKSQLTTVVDGEQLMMYLLENKDSLPDALFLDLNMPRKNGLECLVEIKSNFALKELPVIVYSTSIAGSNVDELYDLGAHYYLRKRDLKDLMLIMGVLMRLIQAGNFSRPDREFFVINNSNDLNVN